MARTVNSEEHAAKRAAILDATLRLVYAKGYERLTIQDIRTELGISGGAFYHYFPSKPALLEALIASLQEPGDREVAAVAADTHQSATEKLQHYFDTVDRFRAKERRAVDELLRTWYTDENAIVRQKVAEATIARRAPLLTTIVRQGVEEGAFDTPHPEQAAELVIALVHGMEGAHARTLLAEQPDARAVVTMHAACMDAIERVLGAREPFLRRASDADVTEWIS